MNKILSSFYNYSKLYMEQATTTITGKVVVWPHDCYITQPQSHTQFRG